VNISRENRNEYRSRRPEEIRNRLVCVR